MENKIVFLQREYKILRIKESANILLPIINRDIKTNKNFDSLTKIIQNKHLLKIVSVFLYRINRYFNIFENNISYKIFLSAFVISYYPDIVFSSNNKIENELFRTANLLINITQKLYTNNFMMKNYLLKFKNIFNNFNALFTLWKFADKEDIIDMLVRRYHSLNKTIDFLKNKSKFEEKVNVESIDILEKQLVDLIHKGKQIDPSINENVFINYNNLMNSVSKNMNEAYWNKLISNIKEENYTMVVDIINDIIKSICSFIPNRTNIHNEIKQNVDIEIIKQLIDNKVFSIDSLYEYSKCLFDWIVKLSAPSRISDFNNMWDNINFSNYFYIVVPEIFKLLYNMIDILYEDMSYL